MMSNPKRRPSPALVVSFVALFVALAGGAYAATKIDTGDIRKGAVTGKKLAKNAVNSNKVKDASLTGGDLADGAISGSKLAAATEVEESTTVTINTIGSESVDCPTGTRLITGGYNTNSALPTNAGFAVESRPDGNGWRASIVAQGANTELTVYALCL